MRGLWIEDGRVRFREDLPRPEPARGEVRVRVVRGGVCATDLALRRGYMGFAGVPGHEFVGIAESGRFAGRRVVGDINAACGSCDTCRAGRRTHCPNRTVLGILGRSGAFAEELVLPEENLLPVPDELPTDLATFVEPTAAAFEIPAMLPLVPGERALVMGDGRLGLLCAQVLAHEGQRVDLLGRHPARGEWLGQPVRHLGESADGGRPYDLVVEATGNPRVLAQALEHVRPRGTVVLKTTAEVPAELDLAPIVVDEIQVVGSRCGPFEPALAALAAGRLAVEPMIEGRFALPDGARALERADRRGVLKILIDVEEA